MMNTGKLLKLARKWKKLTAIRRRSRLISFAGVDGAAETCTAEKGHFVIYTVDKRRFLIPLSYLRNQTFCQLLTMSEEVFGLPGDGPIVLPCTARFMEYVVSLLHRKAASGELEDDLLNLVAKDRCSSSSITWTNQHVVMC